MKISINKNDIINSIELIKNVVKENKIRPVIGQILIEAENEITMTGTDLEKTMKIKINGEILEKGKILLNHLEAIEYIKFLDDEKIEIVEENGMIKIDNAEFATMDIEEYPNINHNIENFVKINGKKLKESIEKTLFAASNDYSNLSLCGIRIDKDNVIASDTYRMCFNPIDEIDGVITIPLESIKIALKIIGDGSEISIGTQFAIKTENILFFSRIIDLSFPDYETIMENAKGAAINKIEANKKELLKQIKKVNTFSSKNTEGKYSATFTIKNKSLKIKGINDKAKTEEKVDILNKNNIDIKIALNLKFFIEYLEKDDRKVVEIYINTGSTPVLINDNYLIMPLAVRDL